MLEPLFSLECTLLKLKPDPTFTAAVKIPAPVGEIAIKVVYKHMTKDAYNAFIKSETDKSRTDEEALADIVTGWEEVDAPFSQENLRELCQQYHAAARVIVETYITELTQFRRGN